MKNMYFASQALTYYDSCEESDSSVRWQTVSEEWLQDIVGEGECDNSVPSRHDDYKRDP